MSFDPRNDPKPQQEQDAMDAELRRRRDEALRGAQRRSKAHSFGPAPRPEDLPPARIEPRWEQQGPVESASPAPPKRSHHKRKESK
jgi:hypothetical protein